MGGDLFGRPRSVAQKLGLTAEAVRERVRRANEILKAASSSRAVLSRADFPRARRARRRDPPESTLQRFYAKGLESAAAVPEISD